jgi:exonuclease SbcC
MKNSSRYKIKTLHVKNFKSIGDAEFDFEDNNLVIFDGPNGYGKTTIYEAIEIILSKNPRRHQNIALDARTGFANSPIHKNESMAIELTLLLQNGEDSIKIQRVFDPIQMARIVKENNIKQIFGTSKLYIDDKESSEEVLEDCLVFKSIDTLFNVLNYVEQDENTFFLKKNPKDRYLMLSSLLGAEKELEKLEKIKDVSKQISKEKKQKEDERKSIETANREVLAIDESEISYKRLINTIELAWDKEIVKNSDIDIHNNYLLEIGKIKQLISQKHILKDIYFLINIRNFSNDEFIDRLIKSYWKISNSDYLRTEDTDRRKYEQILKTNEQILNSIEEFNYNFLLTDNIWKLFEEQEWQIDIKQFKAKLTLLIIQRLALGEHSKILDNLKTKQQELLIIQKEHKDLISLNESECPTCGFNWNSSEELDTNIKKTIDKIFEDYNKSNAEFEQLKEDLSINYLKSIKETLIGYNETIKNNKDKLITKEDFTLLLEKELPNKPQIDKFLGLFEGEVLPNILNLINLRSIININEAKDAINKIIKTNTPILGLDDIELKSYWQTYEYYFQSKFEILNAISVKEIDDKIKYLTNQYYLTISTKVETLSKEIEKLADIEGRINTISKIFNEEIEKYTKNIVDTVAIPFYIFTGKILQQHSLGSGLILDLNIKNKEPQLKINPKGRDQEASYTLSSGQLSATVISLMLVLNRVYNNSKLGTILIDDPLQTLDEINTHSLIEVLKYNFSDQQVVLSTHEERYSKLIRYKYSKFGLESKSFRMKDIV